MLRHISEASRTTLTGFIIISLSNVEMCYVVFHLNFQFSTMKNFEI